MAKEFVRLNTRIDQWKDLFNDLTNDVGDIALLTTGNGGTGISTVTGSDSDLVTAVNELDLRLDSANTTQINSAKLLMRSTTAINTIKGHLDVEQTLDVTDSASFANNVSIDGNTNIGGTLGVTGATTLRSTLDVTDSASLGDNVSVDGNTNIGGTLGVTAATTLRSTLDVTDSAGFSSNVSIDGNTNIGGTLDVTDSATLRSTLDVTDSASLGDNVSVDGNTNLGGTLGVTGAATLRSTLDVADSAGFDGNASVGGNLVVTGLVTADGGIDVDNMHLDSNGLSISSGNLIFTAGEDVVIRPSGDNVLLQGTTSGEEINIDLGASLQTITASDALKLVGSDITLDASSDIVLDAAGNDVIYKDAGTEFGRVSNVGGQLQITSVNGEFLKFTDDGIRLSGIVTDSDLDTVAQDFTGAINELKTVTDLLDSATGANANLVISQIGDLADLTTTDKTNTVAAINEINDNFDTRAKGLLSGGNAITYSSSTGEIAVTDNTIQAAELDVSGNGNDGQALISDGDGTFSWGKKVPGLYDTSGTLLN